MTLGGRKKLLAAAARLSHPTDHAALRTAPSVAQVLDVLQLTQYTPWFTAQDVDLGVFYGLAEADLDAVQVRVCATTACVCIPRLSRRASLTCPRCALWVYCNIRQPSLKLCHKRHIQAAIAALKPYGPCRCFP